MDTMTYDLSEPQAIVCGASEVTLYPQFLAAADAAYLATALNDSLAWQRLSGQMFGKAYLVPRDTCWVGPVAYRYSGLRHDPADWPGVLLPLRHALEDAIAGARFETVLANRYRDGRDRVGWHADDEPVFGAEPVIASVSLGATRKFKLRRNGMKETTEIALTSGSLLVMRGATQREYQHCVPPEAGVATARINLTFRTLAPGV